MKTAIKTISLSIILVLSGCSGSDSGSDDSENSTAVDLSTYLYPQSSRVQEYDFYNCIDECVLVENRQVVTSTIDGNNILQSTVGPFDDDDEDVDVVEAVISDDTISITQDSGDGDNVSTRVIPRFYPENTNLKDQFDLEDYEIVFFRLVPKIDLTIESVTLSETDVMIFVEIENEADENVVSSVSVDYYKKDEGAIGSLFYEDCTRDIVQSEVFDIDLSDICDLDEAYIIAQE